MKIILINGMPRSGKDTAYDAILKWADSSRFWIYRERFSYPPKRAFVATMSIEDDDTNGDGHSIQWEADRETPVPVLGVSYRQFQIDYSEKFMKLQYGEDVFARLLLDRIGGTEDPPNLQYLWVIPDCGFQIEVDTILKHFGPDASMILRIHRLGCSWDSRQFVYGRDHATHGFDIYNNSSIEAFGKQVTDAVSTFLEASK